MSNLSLKASITSSTRLSGADAPAVKPIEDIFSYKAQSISEALSIRLEHTQPAFKPTSTSRLEFDEFGAPITSKVFVLEAISVMVQVISFKLTGKRIFKMAPIHHHFEKKGWPESTVVIRFWIISIILAMIGLATLKLR